MTDLIETTAPSTLDLLDGLRRSGALTAWQAEWLAANWDDLPREWWSDPYLRTVKEHTRAWIGVGGRNQPQQKESTHV